MDALIAELERARILEEDCEGEDPNDLEWNLVHELHNGCNRSKDGMIKTLEELRAPQPITKLAYEIYSKTLLPGEGKKFRVRSALMCAAVYMAYAITQTHLDEKPLLAYFKITNKRFTDALKMMKMRLKFVRSHSRAEHNDVFVLCSKLGIADNFDEIKKFVCDNYQKDQKCCRLSIVYIWMIMNRKRVPNISSFSTACNLSEASIRRGISSIRKLIDPYIIDKREKMLTEFEQEISKRFSIDMNEIKRKPKIKRPSSVNALFS